MTVESSVSMDLTNLFKSCMKTIRTRNKAMGVALPQKNILPSSSPLSQFYTRSNDINRNISSHGNLLRDHQKKYLQDHEQSMTDHERNYMEKVVTTNLRIIDDNIRTLTLEGDNDQQGSKDACECRQNIIAILRLNLQQVNSHFKEMKEKRKKRQKEKDNLFRLQRPAGLKKRQSSSSDDSHKTPGLGQVGKKSLSQDTCEGSQPESWSSSSTDTQSPVQSNSEELNSENVKDEGDAIKVSNNTAIINKKDQISSSPVEEEMENMLGELSTEERQMLEEENLHLYKDLMSNQEEVRQITKQVVELGQMQDFFSEKVDVQAHQIEKIQETIMASTENVKEGNEQVREAMRKDAGFRVWIMFFLIVMSCTILFLDWYNG